MAARLRSLKASGKASRGVASMAMKSVGDLTATDLKGKKVFVMNVSSISLDLRIVMIYQQGCFAGGTVLRVAKDLAENNKGARVLVVCSEICALFFRGPSDDHLDSLVGQSLFSDGASAAIIGADPDMSIECPLFQIVSASQTILPNSEGVLEVLLHI